jgi:hypothetical protein
VVFPVDGSWPDEHVPKKATEELITTSGAGMGFETGASDRAVAAAIQWNTFKDKVRWGCGALVVGGIVLVCGAPCFLSLLGGLFG